MKIKRILPVIAAVAILCSMMIVPTSAASYYNPNSGATQYYSLTDICVDVYFSDGTVLSVEMPSRPSPYSSGSHSSQFSGLAGDIAYSFWSEYLGFVDGTSFDALQTHFAVSASLLITKLEFHFGDFVLPYNQSSLLNAFELTSTDGNAVSASFNAILVNEDHRPSSVNISYDGLVESSAFNLFGSTGAIDELETYNPELDSYILVKDAVVSVNTKSSSFLFYSLFSYSRDGVPSVSDFVFDNGLGYDRPIYENVSLVGFADFLADGIASFMDTPIFGDIGLGTMLSVVISVLIVLILIKMFAN